jgi:hypothetical protein
LPNQNEEFWDACRENDVTIIITNYPVKRDDERIKYMAQKHKIILEYWGGEIKTFDQIPLDMTGSQNPEKSFNKCLTKNLCIQLKDGNLYICHTAAYAEHFNRFFKQNIPLDRKDCINIYKVKNIREIFTFLCRPIPFCKYCVTTGAVHGIKWKFSQKNIEEWI